MNKTFAVVGVLAVLVIGGGVLYLNSAKPAEQPAVAGVSQQAEPTKTTMPTTETTQPANTMTADISNIKSFTVTGRNFSFDPKEIKVKKGDTVKVTFKNADGFHDFRIDEFKVATQKIRGGAEETVQFVADKTGTFEYYCSVGEHRQMGMVGKLIVE